MAMGNEPDAVKKTNRQSILLSQLGRPGYCLTCHQVDRNDYRIRDKGAFKCLKNAGSNNK